MKIVIVSSYNIGNETGTAKVSERLSKQLSKYNQVMYLCLGPKYKRKKYGKNLQILEVPAEKLSGLWVPKITRKVKENIFRDLTQFAPDVIHAQNIVFTGLVSLIWAKENSVPYIVTFHSMPSEGIRYVFPKLKNDRVVSAIDYNMTKGYVKRFLQNVSLVVALNEPVKKSIKKIKSDIPIKVIQNGLNLTDFYKLKVIAPKGSRVNFIYLGTYSGRKNQQYLLKVFKNLPDNYKLNLYGNFESGKIYLKKLQKLLKKEKISNVKLNGFLSQKKVLQELQSANYLVSASVKEVQSLVIVEGLAAGLPVVALSNETVDEVVDTKNGLSLSQNTTPRVFAKNLVRFVQKTNTSYGKTSKYCRESVAKFDIELVTQKLLNVYKEGGKKSETKKEGKIAAQIKALIPSQIKYIFDSKVQDKIEKGKPNYLKLILALTFFVGILAAIVGFVAKFTRKTKKAYFWQEGQK